MSYVRILAVLALMSLVALGSCGTRSAGGH